MQFTVLKQDYKGDYIVTDGNQQMIVTPRQIYNVLLQGMTFTNVQLTSRGDGFVALIGIRKKFSTVNANSAEKKIAKQIREQSRAYYDNMSSAFKCEKEKVEVSTKKKNGTVIHVAINSRRATDEKEYFKGELITIDALCKKFNVDKEKYKQMRREGYTQEEALGIKEPNHEQAKKQKVYNAALQRSLDRMNIQRMINN